MADADKHIGMAGRHIRELNSKMEKVGLKLYYKESKAEDTDVYRGDSYDIVLSLNDEDFMILSKGCMGTKSLEYWTKVTVSVLFRLVTLSETIKVYEDLDDDFTLYQLNSWINSRSCLGYFGEDKKDALRNLFCEVYGIYIFHNKE